MNIDQATELYALITTVRHVKDMDTTCGAVFYDKNRGGCLLCEGVRHGLYSVEKGIELDMEGGFSRHFNCSIDEAKGVIYHKRIRKIRHKTTGENYYKAGKELIEKYGFGHLFEKKAMSFTELMESLKTETVNA